ncbi:MAG: VWA domain-containing protein [Ardenticatenia bacterium]|nr:VWA domain-containing protein [Ardenticatenia bacterium]MBL7198544.1 VWA domain-containing protein [Anaerolineae bacterium]
MPGEVSLTVRTNKVNFPVTGTPQLVYVLIEAMPTDAVATVQMPLNFALVLDHSGSMSGAKLANMKTAAKMATDQMGPNDIVSIVVYDEKARVIAAAQAATNRSELHREIDRIRDRGGTAISSGMQAGLSELRKNLGPGRVSRLLLLTDGQTYGDEPECHRLAAEAGRLEIPVTAFGLGDDWNQDLLDGIARESGGVSDFIDDVTPQKIIDQFQQSVTSAQAAVVKNANLVLRLVTGVIPKNVWQVRPQIAKLGQRALSDRDVQVYLGDLEKVQGRSVLIEMTVPARQPGRYRVAQAELDYEVPATGLTHETVRTDVLLGFTGDPSVARQVDPLVMNVVEKVTTFKLQTRALEEAQAGNIAAATQKLRAAATRLLEMGEEDLAADMQQEAANLEQKGQMSSRGTKRISYATRKLTQKLED